MTRLIHYIMAVATAVAVLPAHAVGPVAQEQRSYAPAAPGSDLNAYQNVSVAANNKAVQCWMALSAPEQTITYDVRIRPLNNSGAPTGSVVSVPNPGTDLVAFPSCTVAPDGTASMVYARIPFEDQIPDPAGITLQFRQLSPEGVLGAEILLENIGGLSVGPPAWIARSTTGELWVTYNAFDSVRGGSRIELLRLDPAGNRLGSPTVLAENYADVDPGVLDGIPAVPFVVFSPSGQAVASWRRVGIQTTSGPIDAFEYRRLSLSGAPAATTNRFPGRGNPFDVIYSANVAINDAGTVTIGWSELCNDTPPFPTAQCQRFASSYLSRFNANDEPLLDAIDITHPRFFGSQTPSIVSDASGRALVAVHATTAPDPALNQSSSHSIVRAYGDQGMVSSGYEFASRFDEYDGLPVLAAIPGTNQALLTAITYTGTGTVDRTGISARKISSTAVDLRTVLLDALGPVLGATGPIGTSLLDAVELVPLN